jgi:hypothetical protein
LYFARLADGQLQAKVNALPGSSAAEQCSAVSCMLQELWASTVDIPLLLQRLFNTVEGCSLDAGTAAVLLSVAPGL